ncbi:MAG: hypothetical protein H7839_05085 [Magnetococcus sp. YQC-5]
MHQSSDTLWAKLELLQRHPKVHAGIVSRFGVTGPESVAQMAEGELYELIRHVEDCVRWFWPVGSHS